MRPRTLTFTGSSLFESVNLIVQERVVGPANPTLTSNSPKGRSVKFAPPFVTNALNNELRQTKAPAPAGGVNDAVWVVGRPGSRLFGPPSLKKSNANPLTPTIAVMGKNDPNPAGSCVQRYDLAGGVDNLCHIGKFLKHFAHGTLFLSMLGANSAAEKQCEHFLGSGELLCTDRHAGPAPITNTAPILEIV